MTCLFCLGGEYKKHFVVSNLGGELVYIFVVFLFYYFFVTNAFMHFV